MAEAGRGSAAEGLTTLVSREDRADTGKGGEEPQLDAHEADPAVIGATEATRGRADAFYPQKAAVRADEMLARRLRAEVASAEGAQAATVMRALLDGGPAQEKVEALAQLLLLGWKQDVLELEAWEMRQVIREHVIRQAEAPAHERHQSDDRGNDAVDDAADDSDRISADSN